MTKSDDIGPIIRQRRKALGLSLESLAKKSGVSSTMLSEVERSLKNPTVKLANQIARALDCTLTDLLSDSESSPVSITRARDLRTYVDPTRGIERTSQRSDLLQRNLELAWYTIPPGQSTGKLGPNRAGSIEQILVLSGDLLVVLGGTEHRLSPGDSVTYGAQTTDYGNESRTDPCTFLLLSDSSGVG